MNAELTICEQVATVKVTGELDAYTAPQVRDQMAKALAEEGARWVVADLTETDHGIDILPEVLERCQGLLNVIPDLLDITGIR